MSGRSTATVRNIAVARRVDAPIAQIHAERSIQTGAPPPALASAAVMRGLARQRFSIGDLLMELRYFPRQLSVDYHPAPSRAILLLPLTDELQLFGCNERHHCPAGTAFFYSREETLSAVWRQSSWGLAIHLPRDRLNAAASALLRDGRRLAFAARLLGSGRGVEQSVERFLAALGTGALQQSPSAIAFEANFYRTLASRIIEIGAGDEIMPPVRIVSEAMRLVRENHAEAFDIDRLATMVGVTAGTLRKGFRICLGMTVKEYIQTVRLEWAHERLFSSRESRTIAEIAVAAGFNDGPHFSRSYLRRFGEPASQTRARAVHEMI